MTPRADVYSAIDTERFYQDSMWNPDTTPTGGKHTVTEWLVFLHNYVQQAMEQVTRNADPVASEMALETVRKVAGMAVACMEQHGAPKRKLRA